MRIPQALLFTAVTAAVAWAGPATAQEWKKYSYPDDRFEVEFSTVPKISQTEMTEVTKQRIVRSTNYLQANNDTAYLVTVSLLRATPNFDNAVKQSFETAKCQTTESDRPLQLFNVRGRELIGTKCNGGAFRAEYRYFTFGNWFYQVFSLFNADSGPANARHFLNSFKIN